jgi:hypothetical protein
LLNVNAADERLRRRAPARIAESRALGTQQDRGL